MTSNLRRWTAAGGALLVAAVGGLAVVPGTAAADPASSVTDYLGCLQGQRSGDLLILFDTTASLKSNDPNNKRADAAKALVAELSAFAEHSSIQLSAAMAGFGWHYQRVGDWADLATSGGREAMDAAITTVSESNDDAFESDFWSALDGAQRDLAAKSGSASDGAPRCQALLWFTDGEFRLAERRNRAQTARFGEFKPYLPGRSLTNRPNVADAQRAGVADVCADGGPADRLRSGNVTVWGIGLSPIDRPNKPDLKLVERVAEGTDGQTTCGKVTSPPGRYFQVDGADQLRAEIWKIANPGAQNIQRFVLDDALTGVSIAANQSNGQGLMLVGPRKIGSVTIPSAEQRAGHAKVGTSGIDATWRWDTPDSVTITVERGTPSWLGIWSIMDLNGQPADPQDLQVAFRGDLTPTWPESNELIAEETTQISLGLTGRSREPVSAGDVPGTLSLAAELVPSAGPRIPIASGVAKEDLEETRPLDLAGVPAGAGTVRLTLDYTTQMVGGLRTTLAPSVVIVPVTVGAPLDRGGITGPLRFGEIGGAADTDASVSVTGPSCAWLAVDGHDLVGPSESGEFRLSSPHNSANTCLRVASGATTSLPVHLTTMYGGNGTMTGRVLFKLAPEDDPSRPVAVNIDADATLANPIDPLSAVPAFIVALVLGLGIPVGLLYLLKWHGARIPGRPLEAVMVPVDVANGEVTYGGQMLASHSLPAPQPVSLLRNGTRSTTAAGVELSTRMGARPFGAGFVEAVLPGHLGASLTSATPQGKARAARLPLAVHNSWAIFHGASADPATAKVLLLRGFDLDDPAFEALLAEARTSIPDLLAGLLESSRSSTGARSPVSTPVPDGRAFGLGDASDAAVSGGFGLDRPGRTAPSDDRPVATPPRPAAKDFDSKPTTLAESDAEGAPDWGSQSFGSFGLGEDQTPGDSTGEREAP